MTASTAIITSFDDGLSLRRLLDSVIQSNVDQIVLMYGGERTDRDYLNALQDDRLIYEEEKERLGKSESLNRSFKYALGDLVFIVSGDISVENNVFDRCAGAFSDDIGVIVPHVIPAPMGGIHGKIGRVLWKLHDCELHYMSARNINAHGGEFVAIRKKLLSDLPKIVNDDAYLCMSARNSGYRVVYREDILVTNELPGTLLDLFVQRIRINFGHQELLKMKLDPLVMTTLIRTDRRTFFSIMTTFLKRYPEEILMLPLVCFMESLALLMAWHHARKGKSYHKWPIATRS